MNDEINRKRFFRRFEFWLIIVAVAIATVLLGLGGCAPADDIPQAQPPPEPSNVLRTYSVPIRTAPVGRARIVEFRDSAGRVCVLARYNDIAISCGAPLAPLDYENLPERPLD